MLEILLTAVLILLAINLALEIACKIAKVIALSEAKKEFESALKELGDIISEDKKKEPEQVPTAPKVAKKKVVRRK